MNFCKECQESILSKFWQIAGSQCTEWIQASFEWWNEVTSLFLSAILLCFWPKINWSLSFFLLVFLLHINNIYFGVFTSKIDGSVKCKQTHEFGFVNNTSLWHDRPWYCGDCIWSLHIWQPFSVVRINLCWKYVKVCKYVCCACVCESHVHSNGKTWNKRTCQSQLVFSLRLVPKTYGI